MKKFAKNLILGVILIFTMAVIAGCGAKKQTATCTIDKDGAEYEMLIDAEGDSIKKLTQTTVLSLDDFNEEQIGIIESQIESIKEIYDAIDGVTYKAERTDKEFKEIVEISCEKKTLNEVIDQGLLPVEGNSDKLSFKKTKEGLEKSGWTVK